VLLLGLSTGHKVGLALAAAGFAGFALVVSMVVPRWRPQFPGRGLPLFLAVCVLLFFGMLVAVEVLGKESEPEAAGRETPAETHTTQTGPTTSRTVQVSEVDYKIRQPETTLKAGKYTFEVKNEGKVPHDLVVKGAGMQEGTPTIAPGKSESLTVDLKPGSYELYCSIPGHKQLGMDQKVTVT
jgi:uncharacterized cupredoxin-like copper-binding protein